MQEDMNEFNSYHCEQGLTRTSECSEHLPESHKKRFTEETDPPQAQLQQNIQGLLDTQVTCGGDSSESSQETSNYIGNNVSFPKFSWFQSMSQIVGLTTAWQQNKVEGSPMGANTVSSGKTNITSVHSEFNFFL